MMFLTTALRRPFFWLLLMSPRYVAFRSETGKKLKQLAGFNEGQSPGSNRQPVGGFIVLTPSGGIPKRTGTSISFVECDVYYIAGDGATRTLTANTGSKLWVGNMSSTAAVGGSKYILPTMHGGAMLANWEDC